MRRLVPGAALVLMAGTAIAASGPPSLLAVAPQSPWTLRELEMRHGLMDGVQHTLEEVGKEFGVTRERIRQIEAKAHEKIRQHQNVAKLRNY